MFFNLMITLSRNTLQNNIIMNYNSIDISNKYKLFNYQWQPKVIAEMNDYQFKIAKIEGEFIWHAHQDTD